jgi:hypothetical protein
VGCWTPRAYSNDTILSAACAAACGVNGDGALDLVPLNFSHQSVGGFSETESAGAGRRALEIGVMLWIGECALASLSHGRSPYAQKNT